MIPSLPIRSIFGVLPIMLLQYAPTFHIPMSSPQMTRMLGSFAWAIAFLVGATIPALRAVTAASAVPARRRLRRSRLWGVWEESGVILLLIAVLLQLSAPSPMAPRFLDDSKQDNDALLYLGLVDLGPGSA